MHPSHPLTDSPADARNSATGEPHAQAGVGGAPAVVISTTTDDARANRCRICQQTEGHSYNAHAAYFLGRTRSMLAIIAGTRTAAEARRRALDELAKIEADPILGERR